MSDTMNRVRALVRAQTILAQIELRSKMTQGAFFSTALTLLLVAVAMLNLAGFLALSDRIGMIWSAVAFGVADAILAGLLIKVGKSIQPGPELASATQVRDMLLDELSAEAEVVKEDFMQARADAKRVRDGFAKVAGGVKGLAPVLDLMTGALKGAKKKK
ncbi:MAG: phage holin family protein [Planctomycetota bacterium]|jgi:hypothetical protein